MKKIETNIKKHIYFEESELTSLRWNLNDEWNIVRVYPEILKQKWYGMGGSITEASCINLSKLSISKQEEFLNSYFSTSGLSYNLGRISIGSNDFCISSYEYLSDSNLDNFAITHDEELIIPTIQRILKKKKLTLIASPWSPPAFMKDNHSLFGGGKLEPQYYSLYADYLVKFLDSYQNKNIFVSYITIQNEPLAAQNWESCLYSLEEQKSFIYSYFLKKLKKTKTKLLLWDHNKENVYDVSQFLMEQEESVAGIAYHWYTGTHSTNLKLVKEKYPNALLFHTEGCCGFSIYQELEWRRDAELYLLDIISDLNEGMNGYIDWNLLLDYQGGPNHQKNYCKSPIILNEQEDNFILTPIYYYLGHVSRYFSFGCRIIPIDFYRPDLYGCASVLNDCVTIVLLNPNDYDIEVNLVLYSSVTRDTLKAHTICTYLHENKHVID